MIRRLAHGDGIHGAHDDQAVMEACVVFGGVYAKDEAVWRVKEEVESCAARIAAI